MQIPHMSSLKQKTLWVTLAAAWLLISAVGMHQLVAYSFTAGVPGAGDGVFPNGAAPRWPDSAAVSPAKGRFTIVMGVHPRCPCTRASLEELSVIQARTSAAAAARILFFLPSRRTGWSRGSSWDDAARIPGATIVEDVDGAQAATFGMTTSGETLLYDAAGRLRFRGGITAERGHSGDNYGVDSIVALLRNTAPPRALMPVFGCSLRSAPTVEPRP